MNSTTQAGLQRTDGVAIPLHGVTVMGEVSTGHAVVTVTQRYQNTETKPVEAVYTFPLPSEATLSGFAMVCDGRRLEGIVREREQAPSELPDLVDGEPWVLFARISGRGRGQAEIRGRDGPEAFALVMPIDLAAVAARPLLMKFWAAERVRDWEAAAVTGRRAERLKERIVEVAVRYGLMSKYTSFLVVEPRPGARRVSGQPETRVIPVNLPAGWAMCAAPREAQTLVFAGTMPRSQERMPVVGPLSLAASVAQGGGVRLLRRRSEGPSVKSVALPKVPGQAQEPGSAEVRQARATARALLELRQAGVTTGHPLHGAQVKKAVDALVTLAVKIAAGDTQVVEFALGVAWLVATGRRTRKEIARVIARYATLGTLGSQVGDEHAVRAYVEQLAPCG